MVKPHYQVVWDDEAKESLRNIFDYIKKRESIDQARRVRGAIMELAKTLGFIPHKFSKDPFLQSEPGENRFKAIWSYVIR
jgi:plasmid stabilization system protein ParE